MFLVYKYKIFTLTPYYDVPYVISLPDSVVMVLWCRNSMTKGELLGYLFHHLATAYAYIFISVSYIYRLSCILSENLPLIMVSRRKFLYGG